QPVPADHDERGVADPGDVDDAEDQIEPEREQRQHAAEQDAVDHGLQQVDVEDVEKALHRPYLSRLRGSRRAKFALESVRVSATGGANALDTGSASRGNTPTLTLPRKRER